MNSFISKAFLMLLPIAQSIPFSSTEIIAISVALGVLITSMAAALVSIIIALKTSSKVDTGTAISAANSKAIAEVKEEAKVISVHVNSAATAAEKKIEGLQKEVKHLLEIVAEKAQIAALLAQSAATNSATGASTTTTPVTVVNEPENQVPATKP